MLTNIVTLKSGLRSFKDIEKVPFENFGKVSYSHSIVTMAICCIVSEIYRDYFIRPLHSTPLLEGPRRNIAITFGTEKTRMVCLPDGNKSFTICLAVSTEYLGVTSTTTTTKNRQASSSSSCFIEQ